MLAIRSKSALYTRLALTLAGGLFTLVESLAASGFAPLASVDFEYSPRGHVMVPVSVNGEKRLRVALDTGAGGHVLQPETVDHLELKPRDLPSHANVQGAHGDYHAKRVDLDSLSVGGLTINNQWSMVVDLSHVERNQFQLDGVLGVPFIGEYRVAIDFGSRTVDFFNQGSDTDDWLDQYGDMHAVKYTPNFGGLIFFDALIGDVKVAAALDTGAGHSVINSAAADALGLNTDRSMLDIGSGKFALDLDGAMLTSDDDIEIVDLPVFKVFGMDDKPAILIGNNLLKNRVLAIAYDTETLYVSR